MAEEPPTVRRRRPEGRWGGPRSRVAGATGARAGPRSRGRSRDPPAATGEAGTTGGEDPPGACLGPTEGRLGHPPEVVEAEATGDRRLVDTGALADMAAAKVARACMAIVEEEVASGTWLCRFLLAALHLPCHIVLNDV